MTSSPSLLYNLVLTLYRDYYSSQPLEIYITRKDIAVINEEKVTIVSNINTDNNINFNIIINIEVTSAQILRLLDYKLENNYAA
jgi:hypothetical protein